MRRFSLFLLAISHSILPRHSFKLFPLTQRLRIRQFNSFEMSKLDDNNNTTKRDDNKINVKEDPVQARRDWLIFFSRAHLMTEQEVQETIKTPAVLKAFEMIKLSNLPPDVREAYEKEVEEKKLDRTAESDPITVVIEITELAREDAQNLTKDTTNRKRKKLAEGGQNDEDLARISKELPAATKTIP